MSYSIYFSEPIDNDLVVVSGPHFITGNTYASDGSVETWIGVPYNYNDHFRRLFGEKGIEVIHGLTGAESIPVIRKAISQLNDEVDPNCWVPTDGNVKEALKGMLKLALADLNGVWNGA